MAELSEVDRQELSIRGHIRSFIVGCLSGLSAGFFICGFYKEGAFTLAITFILEYMSKPQFQNFRNIGGLKP